MAKPKHRDNQSPPNKQIVIDYNYEIFNLAVVALSLINLPLLWLLPLPEQKNVIVIVEFVISVYLLGDAFYRLFRAPSKTHFLWGIQGWLYFVGSLPVPLLRLLRLVPVFLAARRLKRKDYLDLGHVVVERPAQSALVAVILAAITVLELGSLFILGAESNIPDANIKSASDALWWGVVTIGTVGYGDRYPVSQEGRIVGIAVIFTGVALFTVLTSFLAQRFINARHHRQEQVKPTTEEWSERLNTLQKAMEERDAEQRKLIQELYAKIEALHPPPSG